jgi:hypothetical protein
MNTTDFFMIACGHFLCNEFFSDAANLSYREVISEDVHNALANDILVLENGIMLQVAEDYEDVPVENLLANILTLAEDFRRVYAYGRED